MLRKALVVPVVVLLIALAALVAAPAAAAPSAPHAAAAAADSPAFAAAGFFDLARAALGWLQSILPADAGEFEVGSRTDAARAGVFSPEPIAASDPLGKTNMTSAVDPNG